MNVSIIEEKLRLNSYVDSINFFMEIDGTTVIYIKQKTLIARISNNIIGQCYLTNKGEYLLLSKYYSYKCMLIDGFIKKNNINKLIELIQVIEANNLLKIHITGIKKLKNKSFILLINYGGYHVDFGDLQYYNHKLEILKEFYRQGLNRIPLDIYDVIILKYNNQIVAVKREKK